MAETEVPEPRITTDMVVADLAAVIEQWHEDGEVATANRYTALAEFLCTMPGASLAHELLRAVLATDDLLSVANRALGKNDEAAVEIAVDTIKETLLQAARVAPPARGTPWWTILEQYVGPLGAEPDPLVELERRYGDILDAADPDDNAADDLLDEMVEVPVTSIAGVAVMARVLLNSTKAGWSIWDECAASAILEWAGRQTGRNEFIGAVNYEKVGIEPDQAEARP